MTQRFRLASLPLLMSMLACVPQVVDRTGPDDGSGGSGSGGAGGATSAVGGAGQGGSPSLPAVAMTRAQLDVLWDEYWANQPSGSSGSTSVSSGGGGLDPNDLFVHISDLGASCSSPTVELSCGGHWMLSIGIPPALQQVGVYDLDDPQLQQYSYMSETGQPYSPAPDDCSYAGGSIGSGSLEILSISNDAIEIRVTMDSVFDVDPSGSYSAPLCP